MVYPILAKESSVANPQKVAKIDYIGYHRFASVSMVGIPYANLCIKSVWHCVPDAILTIESDRNQLPSVTKCPRPTKTLSN
jgi:hypothetical protein